MKRSSILLWLYCGTSFCSRAQGVHASQKLIGFQKFQAEYKSQSLLEKTAVGHRPDTSVHPFALVSTHFLQAKVYPSTDAVELMQALNPAVDMSDPDKRIIASSKLVTPHYPPPTERIAMRFQERYKIAAAPDAALNSLFANNIGAFSKLVDEIGGPARSYPGKNLYDSLKQLQQRILPALGSQADRCSKTQMEYENSELSSLIVALRRSTTGNRRMVRYGTDKEQISYIVGDLFSQERFLSKVVRMLPKASGARALKSHAPFKLSYDEGSITDAPFVCNIYVYRKDASGNTNPEPVEQAYYVWLGPKGTYYSLIPGCDSSSFDYHLNADLASTLPINIGLGNYKLIVKDAATGAEVVKEISTVSVTDFEADDKSVRRILIYFN